MPDAVGSRHRIRTLSINSVKLKSRSLFDFVGSVDVRALINVAGVQLKAGQDRGDDDPNQPPAQHTVLVEGTSAFSAPITLDVGCGVSRLTSTSPDAAGHRTTFQECGFDDVNGDGLADRVIQTSFHLGAARYLGATSHGLERAISTRRSPMQPSRLPGPLHRSEMDVVAKNTGNDLGNYKPKSCPDSPLGGQSAFPPRQGETYQTRRTAACAISMAMAFPTISLRIPAAPGRWRWAPV